jgi:hypothetical protein
MLSAPDAVQKQLSDAISLIGKHDFPDQWPNLLTTIIENFAAFASMRFTILMYYCYYIIKCNIVPCNRCTN